jgi:hypothetical protein
LVCKEVNPALNLMPAYDYFVMVIGRRQNQQKIIFFFAPSPISSEMRKTQFTFLFTGK